MLKKYWKSDWFLACLVSLAFLLASGNNALQNIERKACKSKVIGNPVLLLKRQTHPDLTCINQIAYCVRQSNILNLVPELAQLNAVTPKAQISLNTDTHLAVNIRHVNYVV